MNPRRLGGPSSASARSLRQNATAPEQSLWQRLRNRQLAGMKFRRQVPVGRYIVDFLCLEAMLVVEVDGDTHAFSQAADVERTAFLEREGYRVIRFTNAQVIDEAEGVLEHILACAQRPHPPTASRRVPPSPAGRG